MAETSFSKALPEKSPVRSSGARCALPRSPEARTGCGTDSATWPLPSGFSPTGRATTCSRSAITVTILRSTAAIPKPPVRHDPQPREAARLLRFPSAAVRSPRLLRLSGSAHKAPELPRDGHSLLVGINTHAGKSREVWLTREQRVRHFHILGGTGTGKSTLLFDLMRQDLENGRGFALLDPHGGLADRARLPPTRGWLQNGRPRCRPHSL
ncbi:MAG: hypothetical protein JWM59_46 [Verrucomicrobiales bacterium]|nr:hypothetical protein [Verrucomicrobiales bacterium]